MNTRGPDTRISFDAFSLDSANQCLWRGPQAIKLRPKAFAVLDHIVGRPGQLVTKEELLNAVWPGTFVGEAVLKVAIRQIREALDDDPKSPRFIETAHRRGYRFIGQIAESSQTLAKDQGIGGDGIQDVPVVGTKRPEPQALPAKNGLQVKRHAEAESGKLLAASC